MTRFSEQELQRWRARLLAKGQEISDKLAKVLAGQDVGLDGLGSLFGEEAKEPPEQRLRRFLDQIMGRLRALNDAGFGECLVCAAPFSIQELDEMPWAERCRGCFAQDR